MWCFWVQKGRFDPVRIWVPPLFQLQRLTRFGLHREQADRDDALALGNESQAIKMRPTGFP